MIMTVRQRYFNLVKLQPTEVYMFVFAFDSDSDCSIWWEFRLIYIDSYQDAKPIIILSKTL